jgi:MFS family permease
MKLEQWRKNQIAVTVTGACVSLGFTLVMPFLPIYVRQLGVESTAGVAFWTGLILSVSPMTGAFTGPIWGRLGDRYGMRIIAVRATVANTICWTMMGFVQDVRQLFALRVLLGMFGGFNNVSAALITQLAPKEKAPQIIGTLQSVQILSAAIGPFAGGILAQSIGIRNTFFVTGMVYLASFFTMTLLYRDAPEESVHDRIRTDTSLMQPRVPNFLRHPEYLTTLLILFFVNMADRTFGPVIPLFLEQLGTPTTRVVAVSGLVISVAAAGEAMSAWLAGKLASRFRLRRLIMGRLILSVLVLVPMVFVYSSQQFSVLRVILALLAGGTLTFAITAANHIIPGENRGAAFGILSSTSILGGATGPLIAGTLAGFSIRSVFVFNAAVYLLMLGFVYRNVKE